MPAWDSNAKAVYRFENNGLDDNGVYNGTAVGTPVFDTTIKHDDSYSLKKNVSYHTNHYKNADIDVYLKTQNLITAEGWLYPVSGFPIVFSRRSDANLGNANFIWVYFNISASRISFRWAGTEYLLNNFNGVTDLNKWIHWAWTYDVANTTLKFYRDNTLIYTNTSAPNPFAAAGTCIIEQGGCEIGSGASVYYCDNHIISNVLRASFPTVQISTPTITDISPATGSVSGGTAVTITGTEFATGATVTFGGDSATDVVVTSATEITCVTPAHAAGAVDVVVTNTDASTVTAVEGFTYIVPFTADVHFTSAIYPQDFTVFLTDTNITNFQKEPYERNEELNVIDTFDFAFDKVTASAPLEFFKFLNNRAQNTLKIKNKQGNTIYIGKVSGVKSGMEINFANKSLFIESYPLIEDISTDFAIYNIAATNPIKIIKQLLDASVDAAYTVSKIHGLATVLSGISISVDTDGEEENTKSIIQSICEAFNIGVYLEDLTVRAYAVQVLPDDATDITPYLVNLRPKFTNRGDLYADKIMLTYTPTLGGTEATITAGTGDTAKKMTISAPIFIDATSAAIAAERARAIYSQEFYEAELEADKTAMFKLGDTVKYPSELGNFICLIIGKNTTRNQITYKVLGVLK